MALHINLHTAAIKMMDHNFEIRILLFFEIFLSYVTQLMTVGTLKAVVVQKHQQGTESNQPWTTETGAASVANA